MTERDFEAADRMTDHEALMWNVEKDPWLNASGASLTILDQPVDMDRLRHTLRYAITKMPRLIERVVPGFGRLSTPAWAPDPEFDLDYHVQEIELPGAGTDREVLDLATRLYLEPVDRTRPLWRFVSIKGLTGGRGALYMMTHHVIADGIGQIRMAEVYQQTSRDQALPPEVDLAAFLTERIAASSAKESGGDSDASLADALRDSLTHVARRQLGIARRIAGEVVLWPADPDRMNDKLVNLGETAAAAMNQLAPSPSDESHGSPLWKQRSRHRRLEHLTVSVDDLKHASHLVGGSLNDAFLAGLAEGAQRYHTEREAPAQTFNSSFVLSTRTGGSAGGNSFTPVPVRLTAGQMPIIERLRLVTEATTAAKDEATRTGGLSGLSGIANMLPTSVVTRAARAQGAKIDFATSNLRSAPFELFCAGAKVERTIVMGPVAGTGANVTAMSYCGNFEIGMFIDPEAIAEPAAFRDHVAAAFADMFAAAQAAEAVAAKTVTQQAAPAKKPVAKKPAAKKAAAKKPAAKKPVAKKPAAKKPATKNAVPAKKVAAKKPATKKAAAKKPAAKKAAPAKKAAATKKPATKEPAPKKAAAPKASTNE